MTDKVAEPVSRRFFGRMRKEDRKGDLLWHFVIRRLWSDTQQGNGYAVAMVNTNGANYDIVRALVETADEEDSPMILGAYEANLEYRGFEYAGYVMNMLAENARVPVASHLDHSTSVSACRRAIDAGFTSVMIDGSKRPISENIAMTKEACALAKWPATVIGPCVMRVFHTYSPCLE